MGTKAALGLVGNKYKGEQNINNILNIVLAGVVRKRTTNYDYNRCLPLGSWRCCLLYLGGNYGKCN